MNHFPQVNIQKFPRMQLKVLVSSFNLGMLSEKDITIYSIQTLYFTKEQHAQLNTLMAPKVKRYFSQSADKQLKSSLPKRAFRWQQVESHLVQNSQISRKRQLYSFVNYLHQTRELMCPGSFPKPTG